MANIWAVHHNPNYWSQPSEFIPERHLNENGTFTSSNHVIVFGMGPRHCLGEQLARMEMFIFLVSLVQRFQFLPDPRSAVLPDLFAGSTATIYSPVQFKIVAKAR